LSSQSCVTGLMSIPKWIARTFGVGVDAAVAPCAATAAAKTPSRSKRFTVARDSIPERVSDLEREAGRRHRHPPLVMKKALIASALALVFPSAAQAGLVTMVSREVP